MIIVDENGNYKTESFVKTDIEISPGVYNIVKLYKNKFYEPIFRLDVNVVSDLLLEGFDEEDDMIPKEFVERFTNIKDKKTIRNIELEGIL